MLSKTIILVIVLVPALFGIIILDEDTFFDIPAAYAEHRPFTSDDKFAEYNIFYPVGSFGQPEELEGNMTHSVLSASGNTVTFDMSQKLIYKTGPNKSELFMEFFNGPWSADETVASHSQCFPQFWYHEVDNENPPSNVVCQGNVHEFTGTNILDILGLEREVWTTKQLNKQCGFPPDYCITSGDRQIAWSDTIIHYDKQTGIMLNTTQVDYDANMEESGRTEIVIKNTNIVPDTPFGIDNAFAKYGSFLEGKSFEQTEDTAGTLTFEVTDPLPAPLTFHYVQEYFFASGSDTTSPVPGTAKTVGPWTENIEGLVNASHDDCSLSPDGDATPAWWIFENATVTEPPKEIVCQGNVHELIDDGSIFVLGEDRDVWITKQEDKPCIGCDTDGGDLSSTTMYWYDKDTRIALKWQQVSVNSSGEERQRYEFELVDTNIFDPVLVDTEPPEITILGDTPVYVIVGDSYVDAGATAFDNVDGELTNKISEFSTVDTSTSGSYAVTYTVFDTAVNYDQKIRTVIVQTIQEAIENISDSVEDLDTPIVTEKQLTSNLDSTVKVLEDNNEKNDSAACGTLDSFINKVEAQSGKKIDSYDAESLINSAQEIKEALGC